MKKKTYLGDSVYAEFDGFHLILTTENGCPEPQATRSIWIRQWSNRS